MSEYGNLEAGQDSDYFMVHMMAMTTEKLRSKGDIAGELAYRDQRIAEQAAEIARLREAAQAVVGSEHRHPDLCEYYTGGDCDCGIDALAKALDGGGCEHRFMYFGGEKVRRCVHCNTLEVAR
jgi:hypothetical protein